MRNTVAHVPPVPAEPPPPWQPAWLSAIPADADAAEREAIQAVEGERDGELKAVISCEPASEIACGNVAITYLPDATTAWQSALDRLSDDSPFQAGEVAALRTATVQWVTPDSPEPTVETVAPGDDPWESAEPWTDVTPTCPTCGTAATWTDCIDRVRCMVCDPPRAAMGLMRRRERIIRKTARFHCSVTDEAAA